MPTNAPITIDSKNLSHAWGEAMLHLVDQPKRNIAPLSVSITGIENGEPIQDPEIRNALDSVLSTTEKKVTSKITASTIFPYESWIRSGRLGIEEFSKLYLTEYFPRLQARGHLNHRGTYFERMIHFGGYKTDSSGNPQATESNQLMHISKIWKRAREKQPSPRSPRHSALQIAIFDPIRDHTGSALLGFPCLQQISLSYDKAGGLGLSAFYPTQYLMDRAYGNYLGLCHLGHFIAEGLGLRMVRLNCFVGQPDFGNGWTKAKLDPLTALIRSRLSN